VKRIADSTVRRLSVYLRYLEELAARDIATTSSEELAQYGGTTSAQVRKDLSFFGSFGTRGLGYSVAELSGRIREILGLGREWKVVIIGAGKIGSALSAYRGFAQRGFTVVGVYDNDPGKVGRPWDGQRIRDIADLEADAAREKPDIAVLAIPADDVQGEVDRIVRAGIPAILNFAPAQVHVPPNVTLKNVNMAMELEGLSYALRNREE
jgi:redox-sensing transcriptional repressor